MLNNLKNSELYIQRKIDWSFMIVVNVNRIIEILIIYSILIKNC